MIPDKVKIGGIEYKICLDKDIELKCSSNSGEIRYIDGEIALFSSNKGDYANVVFMHELVHGMMQFMGRDDLRDDERFTEQLAQVLYQVLKDNKLSFD